jgi:GDPmannose 4,6-dehydratase
VRAIVTGVAGQDGFYMTRLLLDKGLSVLGVSSDLQHAKEQFECCGTNGLTLASYDYAKVGNFAKILDDFAPDLVFNFAAKATGQGMFDVPYEMNRINGAFVLDILEALRQSNRRERIAFCQASSSEMFGSVVDTPQTEATPFRPKSPYAAAKLYAHQMVGIYRSTYGLRCCAAILYNHESIRRPTQFVTRKIAHGAALIKRGKTDHLSLGSLDAIRDWGYAPEFVQAMYLMATSPRPDDYIVATGRLNTVRHLCEVAFNHLGLDYSRYVRIDASAKRIVESALLHGNASKIHQELGWKAVRTIEETMIELVDHEMTLPF